MANYDMMSDLYHSNTGDIKILLKENKVLNLHLSVLKQVDVFRKMFEQNFREKKEKQIDFTKEKFNIQPFLKYLYTHKIPTDYHDIVNILYFFKMYCMDKECQLVTQELQTKCNDDTVCEILNIAEECQSEELIVMCIDYLVKNIRKHSSVCFDSIDQNTYGVGFYRPNYIRQCCLHHKLHTEGKFEYPKTIEQKMTAADEFFKSKQFNMVPCLYFTLKGLPIEPTCLKSLCCQHRPAYNTKFIDKISPTMKDRILRELIIIKS
jgi:hypothetical protein